MTRLLNFFCVAIRSTSDEIKLPNNVLPWGLIRIMYIKLASMSHQMRYSGI